MSAARPTAEEIAEPLLETLRADLDAPRLAWAEAPRLLADGVSARVFSLRLDGAPPGLEQPHVCRVFCDGSSDVSDAQVAFESALHRALADAGFPTPRVLASGGGTSRLGAPFMLMERVDGVDGFKIAIGGLSIATLLAVAGFGPIALVAGGLVWALPARLLRQLHRVPGATVAKALDEAGVPAESVGLDAALDALEDLVAASPRPGAADVLAWLRNQRPAPAPQPSVAHGDFWYGNVLVGRRGLVLIDWTQAALGHPELDLGWMSIQHYSRLPVPLPDPWFDWLWLPLRPFTWLWLAPVRWAYRLGGRADRTRVRYFTALCALRVLASGDRLAAATPGSRPAAETSAWGSPHTSLLLRLRLRRITGIRVGARRA